MSEYATPQNSQITASSQALLQNEAFIFHIIDLFPMPIEIFRPDGMCVFVNRAFLECFHISDPAMVIGKLNILKEPYLGNRLGLAEYLRRVFAGEILSFFDIKVPIEEIYARYAPNESRFTASEVYQDISCFPILDENGGIAYISAFFITARTYQRQAYILKAKEFIESHWLEEFNIDKIAEAAGLSRYYCARLFKRHTGMTPYSYYQHVKIRKIKEALCDKKLSITEAFACCGADYSGSFAKTFKDKVGMTPSQYRKSMLENPCAGACGKQPESTDDPIFSSPQVLSGNEELLFQTVELFPIPIQIFTPGGNIVYINQAVLKAWNVSDASLILGNYNLIKDPFVNEQFGLREHIRRIFQGEIVLIPDIRVPLENFWAWYKARSSEYDVESMYTDILNFPIYNGDRDITYIVSVFLATRIYQGKSDIARAKEYIENHWREDFDIEKIAEAVHLSRYHFARLFKKHTGTTPYSYYQELKVNKLKEVLRNQNLSVSGAFASCGIEYHGNFARVFKEKVGMTPSQYRKMIR